MCILSSYFFFGFVCGGFYLKQKLKKSSNSSDTEMDTIINTTPQVIQEGPVYEAVSPTNQEYHVQLRENVAYGLSQTKEIN